ncbi:DUF916 domain-containing protein [Lacticaseibacillus suihuaensis]
MKKQNLFLALLLGLMLGLGLRGPIVQAASLPFSVQAQTGTAQRKGAGSYFDVVVAPGKATPLNVVLKNTTAKPVKVAVRFHTAATSANGQVDYAGTSKPAATLKVALADLVTGAHSVTIPAKGQVTYKATLTMPKTALDGLIAGALTFSPAKATKAQGSGLAIVNRYSYSIAVVARNTDRTFTPKLTAGRTTIATVAGAKTATLTLANTSATFLNQLAVTTTVKNLTTGKTTKRQATGMQMAPNSQFGFQLALPGGQAGRYKVTTAAYYVEDAKGAYVGPKGQRYRYRLTNGQTVTLTAKAAAAQAKATAAQRGGWPWFVYAAIAVFALLLVVIALLVVLLLRRRKK